MAWLQEKTSRDFICESGAWIKRKPGSGRTRGKAHGDENTGRINGAHGVRREERHLWEIIMQWWLDPRVTTTTSSSKGEKPDSDTAPRNPWEKKMTGLRGRCVHAAKSREHARLRNSPNSSCSVSFCTGVSSSSYARHNRKNEPFPAIPATRAHPCKRFDRSRKRPFELRCRRASVSELRVSSSLRTRLRGCRGYNDTVRDILGSME